MDSTRCIQTRVVPAKAGTHMPCLISWGNVVDQLRRNGLWVPAHQGVYARLRGLCAGTTLQFALSLWLAASLATQPAAAQNVEDILLYKGPDREQKLIEGAKKEGQVVIYSALIVNQAMRPIADRFGKKYPFVKITYWRADSEDI